jgi:organic radical activating enzyme
MEQDNRCTIPFEGSHLLNLHNNTIAPCCKIKPYPMGDSKTVLIDEFIQLRQAILRNEKHPACSQCWRRESSSAISHRILHSKHLKEPEEWKDKWNTMGLQDPVTTITVVFSNKCQMMCSYCYPGISSMWEAEASRFVKFKGNFHSINTDNKLNRLTELVDISSLRGIIISGGEPMLDKECVTFLLEITPDVKRRVSIITNLSYGKKTMDTLLSVIDRHKNMHVAVSLDAIGENISRKYFNWELWEHNFKILISNLSDRRKIYPDSFVIVFIAVSILNYMSVQGIIEYVISLRKQGVEGIKLEFNVIAEGTLCSLSSGEIDNKSCINLSDTDKLYLAAGEEKMIENLNKLMQNNKRNAMLEKDTKEFLLEYMK